MDVDQSISREVGLSPDELSTLNDAMNHESKVQRWKTRAFEAEDMDMWESESEWDSLTFSIIQELSYQLSSSSKAHLFFRHNGHHEARMFAKTLKDDKLKKWKEGVFMGIEERNWENLATHRTSLPVRSNITIKLFHSESSESCSASPS
jgi:hypothetical protein